MSTHDRFLAVYAIGWCAALVLVTVGLGVAAAGDPEHRGAYIALAVVVGSMALGSVLLTVGVRRRLRRAAARTD